jgi:PAS domain S-box-containing protein
VPTLLARLSAVAFELAPDGTTRHVSQGLNTLTGYSPDDALGRNWWELLCRGEQSAQVAPLLTCLHTGDVAGYRLRVTTQTGNHLTWEVDTANRYGPAGELLTIVGYAVNRAACAALGFDPAVPAPPPHLAGTALLYPDRRPVPLEQWPWQRAAG